MLRVAKDLQDRIEEMDAVLEAGLAGQRDEMLEVVIDPLRLEAYNVTAGKLIGVVTNNNLLIAAGEVETAQGTFAVKIPSSFNEPQDVYNLLKSVIYLDRSDATLKAQKSVLQGKDPPFAEAQRLQSDIDFTHKEGYLKLVRCVAAPTSPTEAVAKLLDSRTGDCLQRSSMKYSRFDSHSRGGTSP